MKLVDTHCHLDFAAFDDDRDTLIASLSTYGVSGVVVPSVGKDNWQRVLTLAAQHRSVYAALGIHPMFLDSAEPGHIDELTELIRSNRDGIVAIGECGLDMSLDNIDRQRHYFSEQLKLALDFDLPVIFHHRKSHHLLVPYLKKYTPRRGGIIHAFSGSYQQACQYIDLGFKLGIGGTITYDRAQKTRETIAKVPLQSLVLETDAPDMPIHGRQGMRNSPAYLGEIFAVLCLLREEPRADIERQLLDNTQAVLGVPG